MPRVVDRLAYLAAEHDERQAGTADHGKPVGVQAVGHGLGDWSRDVVRVTAPIVVGQDERRRRPKSRLHDGVDTSPEEVVCP